MRIFSGSRMLAGAAVLVAAPLATVAFAGTSSAVSPAVAVSCAKLAGTTQSGVADATLEECTAGTTGGGGTIANFALNSGDVTWTNGTTTDYSGTATQHGVDCPVISTEYKIVASVTSSTNSSTPVGQTVKAKVCFIHSNDEVRLVSGTTFKF